MKTFLNFIKLIHIHPILIFFIIISILTGTFVHLFVLLTIVLIHEIGHYFAAKYFQWRIQMIVLWVFGGVMKTDETGNRPIKEEVIVTIAGPMQHLFIYFILISFEMTAIFPETVIELAHHYNMMIILFNLLPIYPLDGGKLFFLTLSFFLPFKQAHRYTVLFSLLTTIVLIVSQFFLFSFTLSSFLILVFLLLENRTEWKNHYYIFIRFLLSRLYGTNLNLETKTLYVPGDYRLMDVFALFRRNQTYEVYVKNSEKNMTEKKCLHLYFQDKLYDRTIDELIENKS